MLSCNKIRIGSTRKQNEQTKQPQNPITSQPSTEQCPFKMQRISMDSNLLLYISSMVIKCNNRVASHEAQKHEAEHLDSEADANDNSTARNITALECIPLNCTSQADKRCASPTDKCCLSQADKHCTSQANKHNCQWNETNFRNLLHNKSCSTIIILTQP